MHNRGQLFEVGQGSRLDATDAGSLLSEVQGMVMTLAAEWCPVGGLCPVRARYLHQDMNKLHDANPWALCYGK